MKLVERIQYIMKLNKLNASSFADEIGVQRSSISHVLSGRNKPSLEFIQKVLVRFPKVDPGWLMTGSMSSNKSSAPAPQKNSLESREENLTQESHKREKKIDRIVVFYSDKSFEEYNPTDSSTSS